MLSESRREFGSPGARATGNCEPPIGVLRTELRSLPEQYTLNHLSSPHIFRVSRYVCGYVGSVAT